MAGEDPPQFTGSAQEGGMTPWNWMKAFERCAVLQRWTEAEKATYFPHFLEEDSLADHWWRGITGGTATSTLDWPSILTAFRTRWPRRILGPRSIMAQHVAELKAERITTEELGRTKKQGRWLVATHVLWGERIRDLVGRSSI